MGTTGPATEGGNAVVNSLRMLAQNRQELQKRQQFTNCRNPLGLHTNLARNVRGVEGNRWWVPLACALAFVVGGDTVWVAHGQDNDNVGRWGSRGWR